MAVEIKTEADLHELMATLGSSSAAVADALKDAGIKGKRMDGQCCPVAKWLRYETGATWVSVDIAEVTLRLPSGPKIRTTPPLPVNNFIGEFDDFAFPELDERPPREDDDTDS